MLTTEQINLPVNARNMYQVINKPTWNRLFILGLKIWILYFFPEYFCPDDSATMPQVPAEVSEMPQRCFASVNSTLVREFVLITILRPPQLQETNTCFSQGAPHGWRHQGTEDRTGWQWQRCLDRNLRNCPAVLLVPWAQPKARGEFSTLLTALMARSKCSACDTAFWGIWLNI